MVHHHNSGPGGGTYGSTVTICPNNPNASISMQKTDAKRENIPNERQSTIPHEQDTNEENIYG